MSAFVATDLKQLSVGFKSSYRLNLEETHKVYFFFANLNTEYDLGLGVSGWLHPHLNRRKTGALPMPLKGDYGENHKPKVVIF